MSDNFNSYPSLPPEIQGKIHGVLKITLGNIVWTDPGLENLLFRVKFWGEKTAGLILKPKISRKETISNIGFWTIRCTQPIFTNYLNDMSVLTLDVMDQQWRLIGHVHINLKLYMRRDSKATRGNLASNSGFSNLEIDGTFPILTVDSENESRKLGEIEIKAITQYHSWETIPRESKEVLESFEMNELKTKFEDPLAKQTIEDSRMPKSYDNKRRGDYQKLEVEGKAAEFAKKSDKVFVPKSSLKKIPKPDEPKEKILNEPSISAEWEIVKQKGEQLKAKLKTAKEAEVITIEQPKIEDTRLPSIAEVESMIMPEDPTINKPIQAHTNNLEDLIPEREKDRPYSDLSLIKHLKLSISSLTLLSPEFKDKSLYLECSIPVPAIDPKTSQVSIHTDSFKITNKSIQNGIFVFNHESLHNLGLGEGVFGKLATQYIRIKLGFNEGKGKCVDICKCDLLWEKIIVAPGFNYQGIVDMSAADDKPIRGKRSAKPKIIGKLNINFVMTGDKTQEIDKAHDEIKAEEPKIQEKPVISERPIQELEFRSFQIYLYIESGTQISRPDGSLPNLFITYKTFPDPEKIATQVYWEYADDSPISHKMLIPVTSNDQSIGKLSTGYLTLEVWDKINPAKDELLGLVKLPLKSFATALSSGTVILINSVYPLIAIDEFCAINNLRSGKDVGYLRVCLAMGTPAQVHRLHLSQTNHIRETPISAKTKKYEAKAQETETLVDSKTKNAFELVEEKKPRDWEQENLIEIQKDLKMISESAESIGDLAAFLNPKPVEEIKSEIEKPIKKLEISSAVKSIEISPEKSRLELIEFIKARLSSENVNLEEELKITDRFNHRYVHSDSFAHLLTELRIGIPAHDITQFINLLITENASSTHRRILFMDIFKALDIKPNYSNTKHTFAVTIKEMFNCNFMGKLQNKSSFIKYLFPKEESYLESELLENNSNIQINMNSVHSFTLAKDSDISECFTDSDEGIVIYLCKNVNRSEEQIIAKAVLPIEELADLEKGKRITRVVCLYGDRSTTVDTYLNEFVGKIRLSVEYSQDMTFEDVGKSTELVYERHTQIDRILPRHNTLSIYIENIGGLDKGQKYLRNLGIDTDSKVKLIVSIFFEDDKLAKEFGVIEVEGHSFSDNIVIKEKSQTEITLNDEILSYLKNRSAFVKFMILSNSGDEITMATTKISLISLLINSSISGEFPLLNEYGQFMGFVNMGLSFQIDDTRPVSPELVESDMPQSPSLEQLPTLTILEDVSKIQLNLESAMYLPKQLNGEFPNAYIQFKWFDSQLYKTPPVLRSSNPSWNSSLVLNIPLDFSRLKKPIFFEIWHRSFATENDCKIGETEVDLSVLMAVDQIDGWYHIMDGYKNVGQLKVRVFPTENLYEKITGKSRREQLSPKIIYEIPVQKPNEYEERAKFISQNLEYDNDEQIYKRHLQNMRTLENINQNYGSWGQNSGFKTQKPTRHTSPLRRSKEKNHVWDEHQTTHFWTEKLPEISKESDEEWDQNKINQVLKSINEATELDNKAVNNRDTRVKTSRFYPNEILPNVMISNSEISRIAGIMKGQGN